MSSATKGCLLSLAGLFVLTLVLLVGIGIGSTADTSPEVATTRGPVVTPTEVSIPPSATPRATPLTADPHAIAILPLRSAAAYWELQRTALSRVESAIARHQAGRIDEAAGLFFEAAVDFSDAQFEFGQAARRTGKPWARGLHAANGTLSDLMYRIGAALRLGNPIAHIVDEANPVLDQLEDHLSQMMGDLGS